MYYVIAQDGQRYGPVDLATLNQWAQDNRVVPTTTLESSDGQRTEASGVPGIVFPVTTVQNPPAYGASGGYGTPGAVQGGVPGAYGAPGMGTSGYAPYPHGQGLPFGDDGKKDVTTSFILSGLTFFLGWFCGSGLIFGIMAIVYANNAKKKGHPQGNAAFILALVLTILIVGVFAFALIGGIASGFRSGIR